MIAYYGVCVVVFGLIFGSFLNCTAMRLVRKEDFVRGRSHCPNCGHELSAKELVPVLSYLLQRGRCRHCGEKISARYITAEIVFSLLSLGLYLRLVLGGGFGTYEILVFFRDWILTGCLFIVALTDLESFEIFDGVLIFGLTNFVVSELVLIFLKFNSLSSLGLSLLSGFIAGAVMLIFSLIMDRILKKESLGGGDIKLFALLGLYLGFFGAYELLIISCLLGLLFAGVRKKMAPDASKEFPFGPAIAASGYILLLSEEFITGWYMSILI